MARKTDWIQTISGRKFWPLEPAVEDVDIGDIAHALSLKCRFSGHCKKFYSVAEHSVHVACSVGHENALWGLLHDATEAYLPDIARPIKPFIVGFKEIEDRLMGVIAKRFDLKGEMPNEVKEMDLRMLATEKEYLMVKSHEWDNIKGIEPWYDSSGKLTPVTSRKAKKMFLAIFNMINDGNWGGCK